MTAEAWTPLRLLGWTQGFFAQKGVDAPRLTAELLLASALGCDRVRLYLDFDKPMGEPELARYRELVKRRAEGEPTAYLTGAREFWGRRFAVDARVLVPRPETELLVEAALAALPEGGAALDLAPQVEEHELEELLLGRHAPAGAGGGEGAAGHRAGGDGRVEVG